jgi:hypothetical protein
VENPEKYENFTYNKRTLFRNFQLRNEKDIKKKIIKKIINYTFETVQTVGIYQKETENFSKKFLRSFKTQNVTDRKREIRKKPFEIYGRINFEELLDFWNFLTKNGLLEGISHPMDEYILENLSNYPLGFKPSQQDIFHENLSEFEPESFTKHLLTLAQIFINVFEKENLQIKE